MIDSQFGKAMQFVLGCGLILGAVFFFRMQAGNLKDLTPTIMVDKAVKVYQHRMRETEQLLGTGQSDNIYGVPVRRAEKTRRSRSS